MSNFDHQGETIPLAQIPTRHSVTGYSQKDSITPLRSKEARSRDTSTPHRYHGVRAKPGTRAKNVGYDGEETTLNRMGRIYDRILHFSIFTRYFLYVLPVALVIAVPIIVGAVSAKNAYLAGVKLWLFFLWIEVVWLSLWVSKLFAHFLPAIFQIFAGVVSSGTRKYALILRALQIPISLLGWAVAALATFKPIMIVLGKNPQVPDAEMAWANDIVFNILLAFVFSAVIFLVEKFFIQLISINYHRKQFVFRIKDNKRIVHILGLLYEASRKMFPMYGAEFAEEDYIIADQLDLHKAFGSGKVNGDKKARGPRAPMRILQNVGRVGDRVTSIFGNVAQEITGKEVFNPNSAHSIVVEALEKRASSEALARRLWMSFVIEDHESLFQDDLIDVLGPEFRSEAEEAFSALDRDGNGDVSLDEMTLTVVEFGRERKAIASSMHDVDQAITVLDRMLLTVVCIAIIFLFVAFLNRNFVTTLATAGTALLSLSFVFATTAQEVLGSCIFLFVKHPFDIGDRVDIAKDQLTVDHISLLFTVFRRISGDNVGRLVQIPNIVLNSLWIENVSRSNAMKEQISLMIHYDTSFEDIQLLKAELQNFVRDKENSRDFQPDLEVEILGTSDLTKLELRVEIQHKTNWSNETLRAQRRSKFMCALIAALRRVPIYNPGGGTDALGSHANATYSVAISAEDAAAKRDTAAHDKDAKRLKPVADAKKDDAAFPPLRKRSTNRSNRGLNTLGLTTSQADAIDALNSRDPLKDTVRDDALASGRDAGRPTMTRPNVERHETNSSGATPLRRKSTTGRRKANSAEMARAPVDMNRVYSFDTNSQTPIGERMSMEYHRGSEERFRYEQAQRAQYQQQQQQQGLTTQLTRPPLSTVPSAGSIGTAGTSPAPPYNNHNTGTTTVGSTTGTLNPLLSAPPQMQGAPPQTSRPGSSDPPVRKPTGGNERPYGDV